MPTNDPHYQASYYERVTLPKRRAAGMRARTRVGADAVKLTLRLPADLHGLLWGRAIANGRSLNAAIVELLTTCTR